MRDKFQIAFGARRIAMRPRSGLSGLAGELLKLAENYLILKSAAARGSS
jgi:hypothetical protein